MSGWLCTQWNVEFFKSQPDPFQILFILPAVDEITTNNIGLIRKGIIWAVNNSLWLFFAQDFLVTLGASYVFRIRLYKVCREKKYMSIWIAVIILSHTPFSHISRGLYFPNKMIMSRHQPYFLHGFSFFLTLKMRIMRNKMEIRLAPSCCIMGSILLDATVSSFF